MHIMVDLETMGTRPDAPITAIGAVAFAEDGIIDTFYRVVDLKSSVDAGATIDPGTVMWWMEQSDEARSALAEPGMSIREALVEFAGFTGDFLEAGVWGNGASFDNVILSEAYKRIGMDAPWPFWKDKCYRTVKGIWKDIKLDRVGTHHNALNDAESQAEHLIAINRAAGGGIL